MDLTEQLTPPAVVLEQLGKALNFGALGHTPRPSNAEKAYINGVRDLGMHKFDRAAEHLTEAVKSAEGEKDKSQADLELWALALGALAFARAGQCQPDASLDLYKQTLPLWEQIYGVNSPKLTCVHSDIATVIESMGNAQQAFDYLQAARDTLAKEHGADHVEVQGLTLAMAGNLSRRQQSDAAEDLFQGAIQNMRTNKRPELAQALAMYHMHLQAYQKTDRAKEVKAEMNSLRKKHIINGESMGSTGIFTDD